MTMETKSDDFVNVGIRIRPSHHPFQNSNAIRLVSQNPPVLFTVDRQQTFTFDNIFTENASQAQVYECMVKPLVGRVLEGYNCTVFAYGQTGTGKTYTIGTDPETYKDEGFILKTIDDFFSNQEERRHIDISVSFFEIYNEKVYDLLSNNKVSLLVKGFKIDSLAQEKVRDSLNARFLLKLGCKNRHTSETKLNGNSSRSHAIFRIHCRVKHENHETEAKLNLVDLAGSESAKKTGNKGSQFQEGVNINKGLFHVGCVIRALSTNTSYIPYRQSTITTVLQDSLNKENYITLVACVSPEHCDIDETIQTLEFSQGAKKLRNKPEVNNIVQQFKNNNPNLFGSAVKSRYQTPLKRPNFYSLEGASHAKKLKTINHTWSPMKTIEEPRNNMLNNSLHSISISSSVSSVVFPPISPIIKRCIESVEATVLRKVKDIYENMPAPHISLGRYQTELSRLVQDEIIHYVNTRPQACSSPLTNDDVPERLHLQNLNSSTSNVAKRLNFDEQASNAEETLRAPVAQPRTKKGETNLYDKLESSVVMLDNTVMQRRSTRLSTRKAISPKGAGNMNFKVPNVPSKRGRKKQRKDSKDELDSSIMPVSNTAAPRRSVRLSIQKPNSPKVVSSPLKHKKVPLPTPRRIQRDPVQPTPAPRNIAKSSTESNPMTSHYNNILNILNNGNQKELQKLPSIGPKTAAQIYMYRQLNGQFNTIADLAKMGSWAGNGYQRFLKANFLNID